MPKFVYKPSCILSKSSRRRRKSNLVVSTSGITINRTHITSYSISNSLPIASTSTSPNNLITQYANKDQPSILHSLTANDNDFSEVYTNYNESGSFQSQLASFIITSRLPRNSATKLLKLLKSVDNLESLKSLPMDSRTLLSTPQPRNINIIAIGGGEYVHFGITNGLKHMYNIDSSIRQLINLELWFSIDGLPIDKKGRSFWPILCGICVNNIVKPFIIGAYFGEKKPLNVEEYLSVFIRETSDLIQNGVEIYNMTFNVVIKGIIADAPARAFIKQVKSFSGYYGCEKCVEEGEYLSKSVSFPDGNAELRTDNSFVLQSNEEHHIGISPLLKIPSLGLVTCIPLDYMHLCCLGIMKKLINCMIRGTNVPNVYGSVRLSKDQIILINNRMKIILKWLSSDFARIPSDINEYKMFKSTELRQVMLYTGPFLFKNIVAQPVYDNFMIFNILMRILSCNKTVYSQNNYANTLAKHFLETFCLVYGRGNVSYNVHSIIHLPNDAKKYGVVDNFSAFPYENYLQHLKKIVQPGHAPLVQLYNRISEERECCTNVELSNFPFLDGHHFEGPLPEHIFSESVTQYSTLIVEKFTIRVQSSKRKSSKKDDCVIMSSNIICIVKNILHRNGEVYLVCSTFNNVHALFDSPCSSTSVGMYKCSKPSSTLQLFHLDNVKFKACYFPLTEVPQTTYCICALLHIVD